MFSLSRKNFRDLRAIIELLSSSSVEYFLLLAELIIGSVFLVSKFCARKN